MKEKENLCCITKEENNKKGIWSGILYSIIPHSFCIAFIFLSVIGAATATAFLKKFLLIPYFFEFLILASLLLATVSAIIYLKKTKCFCISGIKKKWKYLTVLYFTMIVVNCFMFFVAFPALANINSNNEIDQKIYSADISIVVQIPCSGHASLIIDEIKKSAGIGSVIFKNPNTFEIKYDPSKTSPEKISTLSIFKTFPADAQ